MIIFNCVIFHFTHVPHLPTPLTPGYLVYFQPSAVTNDAVINILVKSLCVGMTFHLEGNRWVLD